MHVTVSAFRHFSRACYSTMASRKLRRPTHLVLDYDGTLTVNDTMAVLGELPKSPKMTWSQITDAYMEDYAAYKKQPYPWSKYDREEYSGWLASRKWVEERSAKRVQEVCFFRGVTTQDVNDAVSRSFRNGNLELRHGWEQLVELFLADYSAADGTSAPSCVSIVSVNWSETAIRSALCEAALNLDEPDPLRDYKLCHLLNDMPIHANEIQGLASPLGSSGRVCRPPGQDIRTSDDKLRYLPTPNVKSGDHAPFVVYIGDSSTDFDSMCAADLGIWVCPVSESEYAKTFAETFKPLDFVPPPLTSFESGTEEDALFYWTPDFQTVIDVLASPQS